jgi:hypothetical protein
MDRKKKTKFEESGDEKQPSLVAEFIDLVKHNKKYWLIPIVLILLAFGLLIILGSTGAAPFIYTLF